LLLKFAIKDFIQDRKLLNVSEATFTHYTVFFKAFQGYCRENEAFNIEDITTVFIKSYLIFCKEEKKNNPTTTNTKLKYLKAFFNYLEAEKVILSESNPTKKIKFAKEVIKIETFSDEQIRKILNYFSRLKVRDGDFYSIRDYTMTIFLLGTGCRLGELVNVRWKDIDFKCNMITLFGKKREYSSIPMAHSLRLELKEYLAFCKNHFDNNLEYVFIDNVGCKLTENAVKNVYKRLKQIMNFRNVRLSAHTFRHTFAQRFLMAGGDVFSLQKMLRHKKLAMTERYLALWGTALAQQNDKFNPLNNFDY
jgi:integrase/recombinase XerD